MADQPDPPSQNARYRLRTAATVVVVGLLGTVLLGATLLNPSPTQLSAPHSLTQLPEFAGTKQIEGGEFYDPPKVGPERSAPGTVLSVEPVAGAPEGIRALRFLYVSQTADDQNDVVSGLYLVRETPEPGTNGRPLVAVAHGTTGMAPGCGISQAPFTPGSTGFGTWDQIMSGLVGAGYAVVATDYANLGPPATPDYIVEQGEAYDVLNSIRAAYALDPAGLDTGETAVVGHSQGGHAALSAGYEAPNYAPEISLKGVVAISPAIFPPAPLLIKFIQAAPDSDASSFLAFVSFIVNSWSANYPNEIQPSDVFTPAGLEAAKAGLTKCLSGVIPGFKGPKKNFVQQDIPAELLQIAEDNFPIYDKYAMPLLIQQGLEDTTVVPGVNIAAARTFCKQGSTVNLETFPGDVHSSVLYTGQSQAIEWLAARFADEPVQSDCGGL